MYVIVNVIEKVRAPGVRWILAAAVVCGGGELAMARQADPVGHDGKAEKTELLDQLSKLRARMAQLEMALDQDHKGTPSKKMTGRGMEHAGPKKGRMGGEKASMGMNMMGKGKMRSKDGEGTSMGMGMAGVMGKKGGMGKMGDPKEAVADPKKSDDATARVATADDEGSEPVLDPLPSFDGADGIYHRGSTGLFLDLAEDLELTDDQRAAIEAIREESESAHAKILLEIEALEEEVWKITGAEQPDVKRLRAKIEQIASLRTEMRVAFIRRVGAAAAILTVHQRHTLADSKQ